MRICYICGTIGTGTVIDPIGSQYLLDENGKSTKILNPDYQPGIFDPYRPEIIDEFNAFGNITWGSCPEVMSMEPFLEGSRHMVCADLTLEQHNTIAYDPITNPNGFDWMETFPDGTVIIHAPQ